MFDEAFSCVEQAVAAEKQQQYRVAFDCYSNSVRLFIRDLKKLPDPKTRKFIRDKCTELTAKAEKMYIFASNSSQTEEGLRARLNIMTESQEWRPELTVESFERRLEALGPRSAESILQSKIYEQTQKALQGEDIGAPGDSDDIASLLAEGMTDVQGAFHNELDQLTLENSDETTYVDPGKSAADYVKDLRRNADSNDLETESFSSVTADEVGDDDVAAVMEEAQFEMQIPEAPVDRPVIGEDDGGHNSGLSSHSEPHKACEDVYDPMHSARTVEEILRAAQSGASASTFDSNGTSLPSQEEDHGDSIAQNEGDVARPSDHQQQKPPDVPSGNGHRPHSQDNKSPHAARTVDELLDAAARDSDPRGKISKLRAAKGAVHEAMQSLRDLRRNGNSNLRARGHRHYDDSTDDDSSSFSSDSD